MTETTFKTNKSLKTGMGCEILELFVNRPQSFVFWGQGFFLSKLQPFEIHSRGFCSVLQVPVGKSLSQNIQNNYIFQDWLPLSTRQVKSTG